MLGVEVAIRSLFEAPSVAALGVRLSSEVEAPRAALVPMARPASIPLSYAQRRLWFLERLEGGSQAGRAETGRSQSSTGTSNSQAGSTETGSPQSGSTYVIPLAVRLRGGLNRAALEGALCDLVGRHESLRTLYPEHVGVPRQEIVAAALARPALTVTAVAAAGLAAALTSAVGRGFDLSTELPLRAHLFAIVPEPGAAGADSDVDLSGADLSGADWGADRSADDVQDHVLLVLLHHIAGDGWSLGPLTRDLAALYRARCVGVAASELSPLPVQYADYTLWQQAVLGDENEASSVLSRQLGYWKTALADLPEQIELPSDRSRPQVASHRGGSVALRVDAELHRGLVALARSTGASLFMVLQAALAGLLSRLGAGSDIAIGSPIAGRGDGALDDLIGFFVNTLVLRTDTSGNPGFAELVGRVRGSNLAAYGHADVPFERLVEVLNPARSLSRHPLFQVMLAFEAGSGGRALELDGLTAEPQPIVTGSAKFDLSLGLVEQRSATGAPAGIEGVLEYSSDLFDEGSVAVLGQRLLRLLGAVAASPDVALGEIDILEAFERDTILRGWNATGRVIEPSLAGGDGVAAEDAAAAAAGSAEEGASPATLPSLFAAQAVRTPDAVAVIFGDRELTYAALDAHANRLAHHLQSLGVGPETMVGLMVERSPEMLVGLIGILKAGGAYLPLDPQYPRERLAFMLSDAGAPVLVTQQALLDRLPAAATATCADRAARRRLACDRAPARHGAAARSRPAPPRLCHLHIRLNRHAKRRRRRTWRVVAQIE